MPDREQLLTRVRELQEKLAQKINCLPEPREWVSCMGDLFGGYY